MKRSYIREILDCIDGSTISFAGGLPNEELFDLEGITKATLKALQTPQSLQYSKSQGLFELREKIADIYTHKFDFPTHANEILITTGSQQAYDIILKVIAKEEIIVQNPSYIGAINAFKGLGLQVSGFDEINELSQLLNENNDLYLMSDFQNPSGQSYSEKQRESLVKILKNRGNILMEDGAYSLLSFDETVMRPISADYENAFHLGSFSKILAPGLRVGWIRATAANIEKIMASKESIDLHTPTLNQMIIHHYLEDNDVYKHVAKVKSDYEKRANFMAKCMQKYLPEFEFEMPKGGMFIYGTFKDENTMELAKACLDKKVAFVPAEVFYTNGKVSNEARFNFSNSSYKQMVKGIKIIAAILKKKHDESLSGSIWFHMFQESKSA